MCAAMRPASHCCCLSTRGLYIITVLLLLYGLFVCCVRVRKRLSAGSFRAHLSSSQDGQPHAAQRNASDVSACFVFVSNTFSHPMISSSSSSTTLETFPPNIAFPFVSPFSSARLFSCFVFPLFFSFCFDFKWTKREEEEEEEKRVSFLGSCGGGVRGGGVREG